MSTNLHVIFLWLVRLGIVHTDGASFKVQEIGSIDWAALKFLAEWQGLSAVVLDGTDFATDSQHSTFNTQLSTLNSK